MLRRTQYDQTPANLDIEQNQVTGKKIHFEAAESETKRTTMSDEIDKERAEVGTNHKQKPDSRTHSDPNTIAKSETAQEIISEELIKDRTKIWTNHEQILDTCTYHHPETIIESKIAQEEISEELKKDRTLVRQNEDFIPDTGSRVNFETFSETKTEHTIKEQDIDKERTIAGLKDGQNFSSGTHASSETDKESETTLELMKDELDKDRRLFGPNKQSTDLHLHIKTMVETVETEETAMSGELEKDSIDGIFEKPMCLISSVNGRLEVVEDTVRELERIEAPLNVVAIAGLYRTGKSYLMNRLAGRSSGFIMGSSIESTTKGIWGWCKQHPRRQNEVLLLLDTEGLGDASKGNMDHDNKIFTLTTLLSSTLVYNVMSAFNQDTIEKLTYVTMLSQNLKVSAETERDIESIMPQFVLCVRDFNLELEQNGEVITEDEYLENCLKTRDVVTPEDELYNRPRECIKRYFTRRKVFTFDRPASRKVMKSLDKAKEEDLNEDFVEEINKFLAYVYACPGKFLQNKSPVTGSMLAKLLKEYVTAISDGNAPCVEDAMKIMARQENKKHARNAIENYKTFLKRIKVPVYDKNILFDSISKFKEKTLSSLQSKLLFDVDNKVQNSVEAEIQTIYEKHEQSNSKLLYEECMNRLNTIHEKTVKTNIDKGKYSTSGGHDVYVRDMLLLYNEYNKELENIDSFERKRARHDFEIKVVDENKQILEEDKRITEKETKERERRIKGEHEDEIRRMKAKYERQKEKELEIRERELDRREREIVKLELEREYAHKLELVRVRERERARKRSRERAREREEASRCNVS